MNCLITGKPYTDKASHYAEPHKRDSVVQTACRLSLVALLTVEWGPDLSPASPQCRWCGGYKQHPAMDQDYYGKAGHKEGCERQVAIDALMKVLSEDV